MLVASTQVQMDQPGIDAVNRRLRHVLSLHLDPQGGSRYWRDRQAALDFDIRNEVREVAQLPRLGTMQPGDLVARPLFDLVPRSLHGLRADWIIAQTGGATGNPVWTAYSQTEFRAAFIEPFLVAAAHVGFPRGCDWLYAGPSGPHVIARAAACLAKEFGNGEPYMVDFDPRWARKLPDGSFGQQRYVQHVVDQVLSILAIQPVNVLFTTPPLLSALAPCMTEPQRLGIRGVHYGGTHLDPAALAEFQKRWFPNAVHLSGYGNTLFGCCLELDVSVGRVPRYFPHGNRLLFAATGTTGHENSRCPIQFSRLDESVLLINMFERDSAEMVEPPSNAPEGFHQSGLRNVGPTLGTDRPAVGLY